MQRDSNSRSVWQEIITDINLNKPGTEEEVYDAIIVGGGITGLTTALLLQEAGKRCLILEAQSLGFGTTSGTTAHLNTVLDTPYSDIISKFGLDNARLIARATAEAIALIKRNVDTYNIYCDFEYRDGFLYAETEDESKTLDEMYEAIQQVGIDTTYTDQIPVPISFIKAIKFTGQAQFHPVKYLLALTEAFLEKGGRILEHTRVDKVDAMGSLRVVYCGHRTFRAENVIYATHIPPGINLLHFRCAPYRSYVLGVELEGDTQYPEALIYDMQDPYHYFRTAYLNDKKILIVGGNDHKTGHHHNTDHVFTELEAYARNIYKIEAIPYKWSSQYYESADGLPYIGHLPGAEENVYVATGYCGNGMTLGTLAGKIISDLIEKKENPYAAVLSPSRIKPVAGFANFVKENADVIKHFVMDRITTDELKDYTDLAKEEGRVVKHQERQIAIYKDEYGVLKALHPVCTHAKCIVQWNSVEKSWDCPCHGARYDTNGQPLNGPATAPLYKIDIEGEKAPDE